MKSKYSGIKRIIKAFTYSFDGFVAVFKSEAAFRQDLIFCLAAVIILSFLPLASMQFAFLLFSLFLIVFMELINTAIEVIIDRIGKEYHPLSKKAKDIGSLLVLLAFGHFLAASVVLLLPLIR